MFSLNSSASNACISCFVSKGSWHYHVVTYLTTCKEYVIKARASVRNASQMFYMESWEFHVNYLHWCLILKACCFFIELWMQWVSWSWGGVLLIFATSFTWCIVIVWQESHKQQCQQTRKIRWVFFEFSTKSLYPKKHKSLQKFLKVSFSLKRETLVYFYSLSMASHHVSNAPLQEMITERQKILCCSQIQLCFLLRRDDTFCVSFTFLSQFCFN